VRIYKPVKDLNHFAKHRKFGDLSPWSVEAGRFSANFENDSKKFLIYRSECANLSVTRFLLPVFYTKIIYSLLIFGSCMKYLILASLFSVSLTSLAYAKRPSCTSDADLGKLYCADYGNGLSYVVICAHSNFPKSRYHWAVPVDRSNETCDPNTFNN
jgi:hypothetical protein